MAIADSTLTVDVFGEVRTCLVAAAPFITNETTSATTAASITGVYSDKASTRPLVVISSPEISEDSFKFGSTYGKRFINVLVDCYGQKARDASLLVDQVMTAVRAYAFDDIELIAVATDTAFVNQNEAKYHLKSITFTFDRE